MAELSRAAASAGLIVCAVSALALTHAVSPRFLIAPLKKAKTAPDPNVSIANYMAQEMDNDGRVVPIVWGDTDPIFRDAAAGGKLRSTPTWPDSQVSLQTAQELDAPYVLTYTAEHKNERLAAHAELFFEGRLAWKDDESMQARTGGNTHTDDSAQSIAHTWVMKLEAGALKALQSRPRTSTPVLPQGEAPPKVTEPPPVVKQTAEQLETEIEALEAKSQVGKAFGLARDAIDSHPLEPEYRLILVRLLERQGQTADAAKEAEESAALFPDNSQIRLRAIQDLLAGGQSDQAREQLNEVLARKPNDPATLLLQAQTELALDAPDQAAPPLDRLIASRPTAEAYYWRALTRALLGGADGVSADAASYLKAPLTPSEAQEAYRLAMRVMGRAAKGQLDRMLPMFQQASLHPDSPDVTELVSHGVRVNDACTNFLSEISPPEEFKRSHGARLLVQRLVKLCLLDLQDFAKSSSDESMSDARINLGEAMKQSKTAETDFASGR